jgi:hypothetical protein
MFARNAADVTAAATGTTSKSRPERRKRQMPTVRKADLAGIDFDELEEATYSEAEFADYDGPVPEAGTILDCYVKKMWWTRTASRMNGSGEETGNKPMIKLLVEAGGNQDDLAEFDGLPIWENLVISPDAKFRWGPFFEVFDLSALDIKTMKVAKETDNVGKPVEQLGTLVPGTDGSWLRIVTKVGYSLDGDPRAEVRTWLPYDDEEDTEPEDTEPEDVEDEYEDEDEDEDEDEEEEQDLEDEEPEEEEPVEDDTEPEPEPEPTRIRRSPARASGRTGKPSDAKAAPARSARAAAPAASAARSAKPAAKGTAAPARSARGARGSNTGAAPVRAARTAPARSRRAAKQDDPPF